MKKYRDFSPSRFEKGIPFGDERDDWFISPLGITRDTTGGPLRGWHKTLARLEAIDPDKRDHQIHRYRHWGMGWFEIIIVRPDSKCAAYFGPMDIPEGEENQ